MGIESSRKVAIIIIEINNALGLCNSWIVFQRAFYDLEIIGNRIQNIFLRKLILVAKIVILSKNIFLLR